MNRQSIFLVILTALLPGLAAAEDWEYIRALERTQAERPAALTSAARIAPQSEPGTPLVIHGRLFDADSKSATSAECGRSGVKRERSTWISSSGWTGGMYSDRMPHEAINGSQAGGTPKPSTSGTA